MTAFMWNCKEMDKTIKGVVKPNQGQKEMEEEEKKIEEKVGWNVGPTRERKEEMKDVIYIFFLFSWKKT